MKINTPERDLNDPIAPGYFYASILF